MMPEQGWQSIARGRSGLSKVLVVLIRRRLPTILTTRTTNGLLSAITSTGASSPYSELRAERQARKTNRHGGPCDLCLGMMGGELSSHFERMVVLGLAGGPPCDDTKTALSKDAVECRFVHEPLVDFADYGRNALDVFAQPL